MKQATYAIEGSTPLLMHSERLAMSEFTKDVRKALLRLNEDLVHVRQEMLSDTQRQENADAQAKLGTLKGLMRKALKGPTT